MSKPDASSREQGYAIHRGSGEAWCTDCGRALPPGRSCPIHDPELRLSEEDLTEIVRRAQQYPDLLTARRDVERLLAEVYRLRGLLGGRGEWLT